MCYKVLEEHCALVLLARDRNHEDFNDNFDVSDRDCSVGDEHDGKEVIM